MRQLAAARSLGRQRPVAIRTTFLGAHALPIEADGDKDRYIDLVCKEMLPAGREGGPCRCGRCLLRRHRLLRRADGAGVRGREAARAAGQAACRPALEPRRRRARRTILARFRPITSSTPTTPARRRWRRPAPWPCCCPAPSTSCARRSSRRSRRSASTASPMALATDCNPGTSPLTSLLLAMNMACDAVPDDGGRMHSPASRAKARARSACSTTSARSRPANGAISRSGTSSVRPSSSTASASIRCIAGCGGDNDGP